MKRTILKTLSLMIALLMLTAFLPAQAADPQNDASLIITISANNKSVLKTPKEGIRLKIYLVATGNYGKWEVLDQYKDIKVFSTDPSETESEWVGDSLTQLHERIETMGIQATKSDFSDASGRVEFNDLPRGIYYVEMTRVPEYLSLNTLLLDVPDSRGSLRASGTTKGEYNPPTPDFDDTDGNSNYSFTGIKYGLYKSSDNTHIATVTLTQVTENGVTKGIIKNLSDITIVDHTTKNGSLDQYSRVTADGSHCISGLLYDNKYYWKEISVPANSGYEVDESKHEFTASSKYIESPIKIKMTEKAERGKIRVHKLLAGSGASGVSPAGAVYEIKGTGDNETDITVELFKVNDTSCEENFENCVADVNIPVGEVFTSPELEGTNGVLHVTQVYLNELGYRNLELKFEEGKIVSYTCSNFDSEEENKKYIYDNVLFKHDTLPMGEFAIGTNTRAFVMGQKYGIADKLPILIAEKTGPHFAVGDTCYSHAEDVPMYNPDGKECIARDNSCSLLRKEDISKAYFNCHTDITIPYYELGDITVHTADGRELPVIRQGRFVIPGTEELNKVLDA